MGKITAGQIVYLEHRQQRLYAEVIQVVVERQRCWARPLFLAEAHPPDIDQLVSNSPVLGFQMFTPAEIDCYSLADSSDILWPISQFQPALDTEVIALLSQIQNKVVDADPGHQSNRHYHLRRFMSQIWEQDTAADSDIDSIY
jgi:hypothetical protein